MQLKRHNTIEMAISTTKDYIAMELAFKELNEIR